MPLIPIDDARWARFVEDSGDAVPFHHPAWAGFLSDCYRYKAFVLATTDGDGKISAGLPVIAVRNAIGKHRWVSLPFTDVCKPLASTGGALVELELELAAAVQDGAVQSVEVRAPLRVEGPHLQSGSVFHTLPLSADPEEVMRAGRVQVRQKIRKAEREGVEIRRGTSAKDLTEVFYDLHTRTRRRLGVPVQPRQFFELLWERMIEPGLGFVLVAYVGDTPVAGAVFLTWNGTVSYKYSASEPEFRRLAPNNLLLWTAITWGCENDYRVFDFGRTDLENVGLREFKSGWGATEEPLVYSTISNRAPRPSSHRVERAAGAFIRRAPLWVCRSAGAVLYKYAA